MSAPRILIVDDSQIDRMIFRRAIEKGEISGVDLDEAFDALSALDMLRAQAFDAVFLDVNMPGENGFHVLRSVRQASNRSWPMIFMYSSSDHPDDVQLAYAEMATGYLCKPTEFSDVLSLVDASLKFVCKAVSGADRQAARGA